MYGGVITVITSIFLVTPKTANGLGSVPLVGDTLGGPPPGANDAGAAAEDVTR